MNDITQLTGQVTELRYALDTFYFLMMGALVMWMAAGFTMLESGRVRAKNTAEILTKNVGLYSIACIMYMLVGYSIMYPGDFAKFSPRMLVFILLPASCTCLSAIRLWRFRGRCISKSEHVRQRYSGQCR